MLAMPGTEVDRGRFATAGAAPQPVKNLRERPVSVPLDQQLDRVDHGSLAAPEFEAAVRPVG